MSVRWEFCHANHTDVEVMTPEEVKEACDERIKPGEMALTLGYDEVFAIVGTPDELMKHLLICVLEVGKYIDGDDEEED